MGIDMGFDMIPRIPPTDDAAMSKWALFISDVEEEYEDDPNFTYKNSCFVFTVAEHPKISIRGDRFLRCSSKISGRQGSEAEHYIRALYKMAKVHFGSRVKMWHDCVEESLEGIYSWTEVHDAEKE